MEWNLPEKEPNLKWVEISSPNRPSPRSAHSAVFDSRDTAMIVYGGYDELSNFKSDLWFYDIMGNSWQEMTPLGSTQPAIPSHSAVYDSINHSFWLIGSNHNGDFAVEAWEYVIDQNMWHQRSAGAIYRAGFETFFDAVTRSIYLFGGYYSNGSFASTFNDVWKFNIENENWSEIFPIDANGDTPLKRDSPAIWFNQSEREMVLAGGAGYGTILYDDIWRLSLEDYSWKKLNLMSPQIVDSLFEYPSPSHTDTTIYSVVWNGHTLNIDPIGKKAYFFGGGYEIGYTNTNWSPPLHCKKLVYYDLVTNKWVLPKIQDQPRFRGGHTCVYDNFNHNLILFGGWNGAESYNDLWKLELENE